MARATNSGGGKICFAVSFDVSRCSLFTWVIRVW
jgi:hypothetical protein